MLFGYWASMWGELNKLSGLDKLSPFHPLVELGLQVHQYKTGGK
jgi:hypothetical protein